MKLIIKGNYLKGIQIKYKWAIIKLKDFIPPLKIQPSGYAHRLIAKALLK